MSDPSWVVGGGDLQMAAVERAQVQMTGLSWQPELLSLWQGHAWAMHSTQRSSTEAAAKEGWAQVPGHLEGPGHLKSSIAWHLGTEGLGRVKWPHLRGLHFWLALP